MEFTEDFVMIQSVLSVIELNIGSFKDIRSIRGNEAKVSKIVDELKHVLARKNYLRDGRVNKKYEKNLREITLFLILNTDFTHSSILQTNNKMIHLIDILPQFSKCLLTNVCLNLGLTEFYAESICCLPNEISFELLDECNKTIQKSEPYSIPEYTAWIAQGIYNKIYHLRYESSVERIDMYLTKLLDKFGDILKNYLTSGAIDQIMNWPTVKMYQYMGRAIYEMLNLLKICLDLFSNSPYFVAPYYQFYSIAQEKQQCIVDSTEILNKSNDTLKECNKCLMSICVSNVEAVTLDVFCSWVECKYKDVILQQLVGQLAYELVDQLSKFDDTDTGELSMMLKAISIKPKTIIETADCETVLKNVQIESDYQNLWFKSLLKFDISNTGVYKTIQTLIHLCNEENFLFLLNTNSENPKTKQIILNEILPFITPKKSIEFISVYYKNTTLYQNSYESELFSAELRELFNKFSSEINEDCLRQVAVLVLQNPVRFLEKLLDDSIKSVDFLKNIIEIFQFIKPICNIAIDTKDTIFSQLFVQKLNQYHFDLNPDILILLVNHLIEYEILSVDILNVFFKIIDESVHENNFEKATFLSNICVGVKVKLPESLYVPTVLRLVNILNLIRWNLFTFSEEKLMLATVIIQLIYYYKMDEIQNDSVKVELNAEVNKIENKLNAYHLLPNTNKICFLNYISEGYLLSSDHNEQVGRLLKVMPSCTPKEWDLITKYLITDQNPIDTLKLLIDVILMVFHMSKTTKNGVQTYCFQQFSIITKNYIHPKVSDNRDLQQLFIKTICRFFKRLPNEFHYVSHELPLVNLFNFNTLKTMKNDEDFVNILVSISHLEICKIICCKMA